MNDVSFSHSAQCHRQTDNIVVLIADHTVCSTIGIYMVVHFMYICLSACIAIVVLFELGCIGSFELTIIWLVGCGIKPLNCSGCGHAEQVLCFVNASHMNSSVRLLVSTDGWMASYD